MGPYYIVLRKRCCGPRWPPTTEAWGKNPVYADDLVPSAGGREVIAYCGSTRTLRPENAAQYLSNVATATVIWQLVTCLPSTSVCEPEHGEPLSNAI